MIRRSRVPVVVTALVVSAGVATADDSSETTDRPATDETVLAVGTDPRVGNWRISGFRSSELVDDGEVLQPAGLQCLELILSDDGGQLGGRGFCGARGSLAAADLLVQDRAGREFHLLFGQAPESAAGVGLTTSEDDLRRAEIHGGPASFQGKVWILVAPRDRQVNSASLDWIRPDGSPARKALDVTLPLVRPSEAVVLP